MIKKVKIPPSGVKKRVGFDLDGVLADHGKNKKKILKKMGYSIDFTRYYGPKLKEVVSRDDYKKMQSFIYGKASLTADVMKDARVVTASLADKFDLFIISRRLSDFQKYGKRWLDKNLSFPEGNIYFVDRDVDKAEIIKKLGIEYYIDDKPSVLETIDDSVRKFLFKKETGFSELLKSLGRMT